MTTIIDILGLPPRMSGALCAQCDPEAWFPTPGDTSVDARAICRTCPAFDQCREWIDQHEETHHMEYGIWAGEGHQERIQRRRVVRGVVTVCESCGRPVRPRRATAEDFPGTMAYGRHGRCCACYSREQRTRRKEEEA